MAVIAMILAAGAAVASAMETQPVHLAAQLDVGLELSKQCARLVREAGALCDGREPFVLHADAASGCSSYFRCLPGHGACIYSCPAGQLFNTACSCCQDAASQPISLATCAPPSPSSRGAAGRALRSVSAAAAAPISQQQALVKAAADEDDASVTFNVAANTITTTSPGGQQQVVAGGSGGSGGSSSPAALFNAWGKRYSAGPFAARAAVKEPALASAVRAPAATPAKQRTVVNEIGSHATVSSSSTARLPVSAEDDSGHWRRALLQAQQPQQQQQQQQQQAAGSDKPWLQPEEAFARPPAARHLDTKRHAKQQQQQPQQGGGSAAVAAFALLRPADVLLGLDAPAAAAMSAAVKAQRSSSSGKQQPSTLVATAAKALHPAEYEGGATEEGGLFGSAHKVLMARRSGPGSDLQVDELSRHEAKAVLHDVATGAPLVAYVCMAAADDDAPGLARMLVQSSEGRLLPYACRAAAVKQRQQPQLSLQHALPLRASMLTYKQHADHEERREEEEEQQHAERGEEREEEHEYEEEQQQRASSHKPRAMKLSERRRAAKRQARHLSPRATHYHDHHHAAGRRSERRRDHRHGSKHGNSREHTQQ